MDISGYLERIGFTDGGSAAENLRRLHKGHITHIPFENVDVLNGKALSLKTEALYDKMVTRRRGGYCFEMNGLFRDMLREMGFEAYSVLARISRGEAGFGGYNHRMTVAYADGKRYACDVGYGGDCFVEPILLEPGLEQTTHGETYRMVEGNRQVQYCIQIKRNGTFVDLLGFNDTPTIDEDFVIANFYTNFSPDSGFRKMMMLNLFTETGRYSMFNYLLTIRDGEKTEKRTVTHEELPEVMRRYFGIDAVPEQPFLSFGK